MEFKDNCTVCYFDHGEDTITCVASLITGKEQVYINDQLVSEKRSFRFKSVHHFQLNGQQASITISVGNLLKGPYTIEFWLDGTRVDSDEWNYQRLLAQAKSAHANKSLGQVMGVYFIYGMIGGFVGALFGYLIALAFKG